MAKKSFEQTMKQLEDIVNELEKGDIPLEKALKIFEEGIKLSNQCSEILEQTERKISILLKDQNGVVVEKPFVNENESDMST
ncbi:MAG: exodeoxyribonuclease VII small subunit [Proteobacteria bacterium]|nr:exodeoxyribonuclease VII small subunit [Pseudomonadota bacterium]